MLMRLRTMDASAEKPDLDSKLANLAEQTSDAIVITDGDGRITLANPAFVTLSQAVDRNQIKGRMLGDWIGRTPNDLAMIIAKVRKDASTGLFATSARGEKGQIVEIEVSAVLIPDGDGEYFGFIMRVAHGRSAAGRADSLPVAGQIH